MASEPMKSRPLWKKALLLAFAVDCGVSLYRVWVDAIEHDWQWARAEFLYGQISGYGYGQTSHWGALPAKRRNP